MLIEDVVVWGGSIFISAVFLDSLRFKFTRHATPRHIFTTLRNWSGIALFYPLGPWVVGFAEILASLLLIGAPAAAATALPGRTDWIGPSQFAGAAIAFAIMSGAIVFHLFTPLGLRTPVKWEGETALKSSPALFLSACVCWVLAIAIMALRWEAIRSALALSRGL